MYDYKVIGVPKVIDGDTLDLDLDLGFYARLRVRIRLDEIDTYEVYGKNAHELGVPARDFAADWLMETLERGALMVKTFKLSPGTPTADGSFGRWLGQVYDADTGDTLAASLALEGFADENS